MISREDFIFAIGFDGAEAVVDGRAKREFGKLSIRELTEAGQWRAAFAAALWSGKEEDIEEFRSLYNRASGSEYKTVDELKRLFGVQKEEIAKALVL
ncbi:MAG: hypothetical protein GX430_15520 [Treponema sp.]|nr:hypothetical protein [Treponema sp.]